MKDKYIIIGSVDLRRPNAEILFSSDDLEEVKKVNALIEAVEGISGYREEIEEEEGQEQLKKYDKMLGYVTVAIDSPFCTDDIDNFIPEVCSHGIFKAVRVV